MSESVTPMIERLTGGPISWCKRTTSQTILLTTSMVAAVCMGGCESDLTVGRAALEPGACAGCESLPPGEGAPECEGADTAERAVYEAWTSAPNELQRLAGTRWSGYIETGPDITLSIERDQRAQLEVGLAPYPEPEKDEGFLCEPGAACRAIDLFEGGIYPIHGASFDARRLEFVVNPYSAFDAWCQLQEPKLRPDDAPAPCQYDVLWTASFDSPCLADDAEVSCHWLEIARSLAPCVCTSGTCFSRTEWAPEQSWDYGDGFRVDLTYDPDEDTLFGSILSYLPCCPGEVFRAVRLWRLPA